MILPTNLFSKTKKRADRTLHLHIGCGKTGSSALQLWLAQNSNALNKAGLHYPLFKIKAQELDDYTITSGNGVVPIRALQNDDNWQTLFNDLFAKNNQIVLSSETFQTATVPELTKLKTLCDEQGVRINIVVYMRDFYDISYSAYVQGIKRHNFRQPFSAWIQQIPNLQQLAVLEKFESVFDSITLLHYDHEKQRGLENSFCEAIGIKPGSIPAMKKTKVNRSLTVKEIQMLRVANQLYYDKYKDVKAQFCVHISNFLIASRPELETEILYDESVEKYLTDKYKAELDRINERYLTSSKLAIFNKQHKRIVEQEPRVGEDTKLFIDAMIEAFHRMAARAQGYLTTEKEVLQSRDPRLPEVLRDEAIKREESDLQSAYCLMHAAATFRPNGPLIKRRLNEYADKLGLEAKNESLAENTNRSANK